MNKHPMLCGVKGQHNPDCKACNRFVKRAMKDYTIAELEEDLGYAPRGSARERRSGANERIVTYSSIYWQSIKPNRCGDLLKQPYAIYEIACIGDSAVAEAQVRAHKENERKHKQAARRRRR